MRFSKALMMSAFVILIGSSVTIAQPAPTAKPTAAQPAPAAKPTTDEAPEAAPSSRSPAGFLRGGRAGRRRQRKQPQYLRHRRRAQAPRAAQAEHQSGHRREGMTVDCPQVDRLVPEPGQ
jgi:hypothetical protein